MRPWHSMKRVIASQQLSLRNSNQRKSKNKSLSNSQRRKPEGPSLLILNHLLKGLSKSTTKKDPEFKEVVREVLEEVEAEEAVSVVMVRDHPILVEVRGVTEVTLKVMTSKVTEVEADTAVEVKVEAKAEVNSEVEANIAEEAKAEAEVNLDTDPKQLEKVRSPSKVMRVRLSPIEKKKMIIKESMIMDFREKEEKNGTHMTEEMVQEEVEDSLRVVTEEEMLEI